MIIHLETYSKLKQIIIHYVCSCYRLAWRNGTSLVEITVHLYSKLKWKTQVADALSILPSTDKEVLLYNVIKDIG